MTRWIWALSSTVALALLAGCTIGNWNICGPQTPAAYCDAKALKELLHPKPYRDLWVKDGASEDAKRLDWLACGGEPDGWWKPTENELKRFQRLDDPHEFFPAYRRAGAEFQRCLIRKGLRWTGPCDSQEMQARPACGAP